MRPSAIHVVRAVCLALAGLGLVGCGDDVDATRATAAFEIVVDLNRGDGGPPLEAPLGGRAIALASDGDVLVAEDFWVRRYDVGTGTLSTIAATELKTCLDGSSAESGCGGLTAIAADAAGRVYFGVADGRVFRVTPGGGPRELVADRTLGPCDRARLAGPLADACFGYVNALAVDAAGVLYVADGDRGRVFRVDVAAGTFALVAGNGRAEPCAEDVPATEACIGYSVELAVDADDGLLLASPQTVRRVDLVSGLIHRVAGRDGCPPFAPPRGDGGPALDACFGGIVAAAVAPDGNLFLADVVDARIRRVDRATGVITTFDDGFDDVRPPPNGLAVDEAGRLVTLTYTRGYATAQIRRYRDGVGSDEALAGRTTPATCGDGGAARDACLGLPLDVALDDRDAIYVTDADANRVRRIADGIITTVAGNGATPILDDPPCADGVPATATCLRHPTATVPARDGGFYVLEEGGAQWGRVRRVDARGVIATVLGGCVAGGDPFSAPAADGCMTVRDVALGPDGAPYVTDGSRVGRLDERADRVVPFVASGLDCVPFEPNPAATCFSVDEMAFDRGGNLYLSAGARVRRVDAATGAITIVAGNGTLGTCGDGGLATNACIDAGRVAPDDAGNLFLGGGGVVRRVDAATGIITTVAGRNAPPCSFGGADFVPPDLGCATVHAIDARGRFVYPEVSRYTIGRVVRSLVPAGRPVR